MVDLGTDTDAVRIDYPDKAREVGEAIRGGDAERGVLVCGSGVGAAVAACKMRRDPRRDLPRHLLGAPGRRARRHERALPRLGGVGPSLAAELVRAFLGARFDGGERYVARLEKVEAMEREMKHG